MKTPSEAGTGGAATNKSQAGEGNLRRSVAPHTRNNGILKYYGTLYGKATAKLMEEVLVLLPV